MTRPWILSLSLLACGRASVDVPARVDVPGRLEADVRHLVTAFAPRDHRHADELLAAATWLDGRLAAAGGKDNARQRFEVDGRGYANVVARFGPRGQVDPKAPRVVVGAHYDSAGPLPAANDNGSGVAVLLELARRLGEAPPDGVVELVAWTLEEPPHFATDTMGSAVHARALAAEGVTVRAVISLETLGIYHDAPGSQRFPDPAMAARYGDRGDFVAVVGRHDEEALIARVAGAFHGLIRAEALAAPRGVTGVDFSDHRSYWPYGMPAIMLTDTAFFRSDTYHTAADVPEVIDYGRLARVADGVERAVRDLAGAR